jgi:uncharacterized phage protein gp47/JayE
MALEDLPNGFVVPTRGEIRDRFQRDYLLRQPGAPTGEGSQPFIDGSVIADTVLPIYANSVSIARGANLADMTREQLKAEARALGIPEELPEGAGGGFVLITASAGGVYIPANRELRDDTRKLRFKCLTSDTYFDGKPVPVTGIDKGPQTNLPAGARLKWTNPPPGLGSIAIVQADADGAGFTGGRAAESDDDIRGRISTTIAEPPAGGNVAEIRKQVKNAGRDLGIAVQEVFVYPAITGSGHYAYVFTLRPGEGSTSRIPDATQIAAVRAYIHRAMPEDDGIFAAEIIDQEVTAKLAIRWANTAVGWSDAQPWPLFAENWTVQTVTSATAFRVHTEPGTPTPPEAGKTIAFYDRVNRTFARKRILSATDVGTGYQFDLVVDQTNNASNLNYLPVVDEEFCPYSESLAPIVKPLLDEVDLLGPGEQEAAPFDEGTRQKRQPESPGEWPSELRHKTLNSVEDLPAVHDVHWLAPEIPYGPLVGVAAASSNMVAITRVLAYPL